MRRSGRGAGLFGVLAGAVPVAIAVGLVLFAVWRWRSAQATPRLAVSRSARSGGYGMPSPLAERTPRPGPARAPRASSAVAASGTAPETPSGRPRGRMEELLARAREEDES